MAGRKHRRDMPSKSAIYAFWINAPAFLTNFGRTPDDLASFCGPSEGSGTVSYGCFACGDRMSVHRAHIRALSEGGSNDCGNLHLLCASCHAKSEHMTAKGYEAWMMRTQLISEWDHMAQRHGFLSMIDMGSEAEAVLKAPNAGVISLDKHTYCSDSLGERLLKLGLEPKLAQSLQQSFVGSGLC